MSEWKAKRFWKDVTVDAAETGFRVLLDGRPARTPGKTLLEMPTQALADAVAAEWAAQEEELKPETMPFTKSVNSAIERVTVFHADVAKVLGDYAETDLLCYRADGPSALVDRQAAAWDPMLEWAANTYAARLNVTSGVIPIAQDEGSVASLRAAIAGYDPFPLTAVHDLITLSGSCVIGLAAAQGVMAPETLFDMSRIDEEFQAELWGRDEEAEASAASKKAQFLHAHRFLDLCAAR